MNFERMIVEPSKSVNQGIEKFWADEDAEEVPWRHITCKGKQNKKSPSSSISYESRLPSPQYIASLTCNSWPNAWFNYFPLFSIHFYYLKCLEFVTETFLLLALIGMQTSSGDHWFRFPKNLSAPIL